MRFELKRLRGSELVKYLMQLVLEYIGKNISNDGLDLAAGVGLEFELGSIAVRGEVEYFDILDQTWMYTVGATITF